jgi:type II restriction enzyme
LATGRQITGDAGEVLVANECSCPKCKRIKTLKRLPTNFKCADLICDFCGFLAQVKTCKTNNVAIPPASVLGAAWGPQKERMDAAIYFPLYLVAFALSGKEYAIYYLSADLQDPDLFEVRKPLGRSARRAGWQGFTYRLAHIKERLIRLK